MFSQLLELLTIKNIPYEKLSKNMSHRLMITLTEKNCSMHEKVAEICVQATLAAQLCKEHHKR